MFFIIGTHEHNLSKSKRLFYLLPWLQSTDYPSDVTSVDNFLFILPEALYSYTGIHVIYSSTLPLMTQMVKNLPAMWDPGSIPGSGRSPGEGNGNPLQYSCLENPMDREARSMGGYSPWGRTQLSQESNTTKQLTLCHYTNGSLWYLSNISWRSVPISLLHPLNDFIRFGCLDIIELTKKWSPLMHISITWFLLLQTMIPHPCTCILQTCIDISVQRESVQ